MKLDETVLGDKLTLDVTPLIDIVFLLVLFFAVSTSFISAEDLADLEGRVVSLGEDKSRLEAKFDEQASRVRELTSELLGADQDERKLQWKIETLQQEEATLSAS